MTHKLLHCSRHCNRRKRFYLCNFHSLGFHKGTELPEGASSAWQLDCLQSTQYSLLAKMHHVQKSLESVSHGKNYMGGNGRMRRACLNPKIPRWSRGRVRASPAETNSRCRHRLPQSPPLCPSHCRSRQRGCHRSIRGRSRKG